VVLTPLPDDRRTTLRAAGMTTPAWIERKACRPEHSALFFPAGSGSEAPDYGPALALCRGCEVQEACRAEAERSGDIGPDGYTNHGQVVGGCAPKQRPLRQPNGKPDSECGTRAGYMRHWRYGEPYCDPCRVANSIYSRAKMSKKRAS
jgi:hypothetical protein